MIATALIALTSGRMQAEIVLGESLEWLAETCSHVGIFSSAAICWGLAYPEGRAEAPVCGRGIKQLRGTFPETFVFRYPIWETQRGETEIYARDGDAFLVFARQTIGGDIRVVQVISLSRPLLRPSRNAALRPDFTVLTDGRAILSVVKERIRLHRAHPYEWGERAQHKWTNVPIGTAAFDSLWGRSECYLLIPDDLLHIAEEHSHE